MDSEVMFDPFLALLIGLVTGFVIGLGVSSFSFSALRYLKKRAPRPPAPPPPIPTEPYVFPDAELTKQGPRPRPRPTRRKRS